MATASVCSPSLAQQPFDSCSEITFLDNFTSLDPVIEAAFFLFFAALNNPFRPCLSVSLLPSPVKGKMGVAQGGGLQIERQDVLRMQ